MSSDCESRKKPKKDSLVPHTITNNITGDTEDEESEIIVVQDGFLPPKMFHDYCSLKVQGRALVFLGSVEERFCHDRIELHPGQVLHVQMDPFNWICIQSHSSESCTISYTKRTVEELDYCLPAVEDELKEKFAEESTITLENIDLFPKVPKFEWQECVNAMVHWYQVSNATKTAFEAHPQFLKWLEDLTNLKLAYSTQRPVWRRFKAGHYVIMNDKYPQEPGLDVIYTFETTCASRDISNWIYLDGDGEELLRVPCDKPRCLTLVYKTADENGESSIKRFKQYWPHCDSSNANYAIQMVITFPVVDEN